MVAKVEVPREDRWEIEEMRRLFYEAGKLYQKLSNKGYKINSIVGIQNPNSLRITAECDVTGALLPDIIGDKT